MTDTQVIELARKRGAVVIGAPGTRPPVDEPRRILVVDSALAPPIARGLVEDPSYRGMNKTERRYAAYLDLLRHAGDVRWWEYEGWKFRLADLSFWTPDFVLMRADRALEVVDVKGRKGDSYYAEEDAMLKIRFVAAHFPIRVLVAWETSRDHWTSECFSPEGSI